MKVDVQEQAPTPNPPKAPPSQDAAQCTREGAKAWIVSNHKETPPDSEVEALGKRCWPAWEKHWTGGWTAAWATWTKDRDQRQKFLRDAVDKLAQVGLPKPVTPDHDDDLARQRATESMDRRIAEAVRQQTCDGCGKTRKLPPGVTHCYLCRKLVEVGAP